MRANAMTAVAAALFALAAAGLGASGWLYWRSLPAIAEAVSAGGKSDPAPCLGAASALGFEAKSLPDGSVAASLAEMSHPALDFGRASALIAACRGYRLASFCAGPGCGPKAMELKLAPARTDGE